jgi:hypothetical protein
MTANRLITLSAWRELPPKTQGYALYMQGALPGSELKDATNPYPLGSFAHANFEEGVRRGVLEAQDSEE